MNDKSEYDHKIDPMDWCVFGQPRCLYAPLGPKASQPVSKVVSLKIYTVTSPTDYTLVRPQATDLKKTVF